jgi:GNAT superfamily N-acetyltransferase
VPDVRPATTADLPAIGRTLAAAFATDPIWHWLRAPGADWDRHGAGFFAAEAKAQLAGHGEVLVDDQVRGAAIWAPPKRWKSTTKEAVALAVPSLRLFRAGLPRAMRMIGEVEAAHPVDPPHWYLAILGTDPAHQGAGVGSALIRAVTDRCDAEGLGAYLESSKEQNVPFYARHGFEVQEAFEPAGAPTMWRMWRDPQG